MFLCTGFPFNMSILIPELLRTFEKSKAETALVQSITAGILYIAGTLCGKFVARYGARMTGITGSLLATLGLVFSFFAKSIPHLIATLGVVAGLGFSATFISAITSVGEYFEGNSKLMALSFLSIGSGCGGIGIPLLMHALIDEFGWRGCLLIIGGLMANMVCFFAVCKPVSIGIPQSETKSKHDDFTKSLRSLLTNNVYIAHVLAMCCTIPVINTSLIFMIDFLKTKDFDSETAIVLYLYLHIGNTLCGVVPGLCKKYIPHTSVLLIPAFFTMIGSTVTACLPNGETYTQYVVLLVGLGMTLGVSITTVSMTTMKLVGLEHYSAGLGVLMTILGISNCIAGPLAGLLVDLTGSYTKPFYGMSASLGLATCLLVLAAALKQKSKKSPLHNEADITTAVETDLHTLPP